MKVMFTVLRHWFYSSLSIVFNILNFSGQERFGNMTRVYYKEAVGACVVFDVTRASTFEAVTKWKNDLDSKVQLPDGSSVPCVLLANKVCIFIKYLLKK